MTRFVGLKAWDPGAEIIECETDRGVVDLHNAATLESIELLCLPDLRVPLRFHDSGGQRFQLVFSGVLDLAFNQDPDDALRTARNWNPEVVETFFGIDYAEGPVVPSGCFNVATILGLIELRAAEVAFIWVAQ